MPFDQLAQSPRTQAAQGAQQGGGDAESFFRDGFRDMAYAALEKSNPDLMAEVITFRHLEVNPDEGTGVGAFVLSHAGDIVYVPVIVSDNTIKPLDLFYSRKLDRYYPLTKEWLQQSSKSSLSSLGEGVKTPKTLPTDVDIRNLVVPPTTGRYSYAAATDTPALPRLLAAAPNAVKTAFARVLTKNPNLLKTATACYGATALTACLQLREEKTAATLEKKLKHDVFVASVSTPLQYLKDELDPGEVGKAFSTLRTYGFYAKDRRKSTDKLMVMEEGSLGLMEPKTPGIYTVYMSDGSTKDALIVPNPLVVGENLTDEGREKNRTNSFQGRAWAASRVGPCSYLVLFADGKYCRVRGDLLVEPVATADQDDVRDFLKGTKARPSNGETGALVCSTGPHVRAVEPVTVSKLTDSNDQVSFTASYFGRVIIGDRIAGDRVMKPAGEDTLVLSKNFRWWPCTDQLMENELLRTPKTILMAWETKMLRDGAKPLTVKKASQGFFVGTDRTELPLHKAVEKVARDWNVSVPEAIEFVKRAALQRSYAGWVVKSAADDKKKAAGGEPSPDEQMAMQQQMAMAQQPPPPSGLDLAVAEQMQQIQMQIQSLQDKANALQMVQQRAMQIDSGGGAAAAPMGAAAMMGGPAPAMAGMPPQDPSMGGTPGMPPQGMDPSMGGAPGMPPQGMDPSMGGAPGMDPSMGGAPGMPPQGMDPAMMQQMQQQQMAPPPAAMTDDLTPENIESQINPQFLEQAGALEQDDVFDAAAVASLASQKNLRELTQAYVPSLERTLDNLGRILMLFDLREGAIKEQAGNELYSETEENVRDVFRGLGDLLLKINQHAQPLLPNGGRHG